MYLLADEKVSITACSGITLKGCLITIQLSQIVQAVLSVKLTVGSKIIECSSVFFLNFL